MEYSKHKTQGKGIVMVLDDMVLNKHAVNKHRDTLLTKLFMMGRHHLVSAILTSQKYNAIPTNIRANASHTIVYGLSNKTERRQFLSDCSDCPGIELKYQYAVSKPYGFLFLNRTSAPVRAFRCFGEELDDPRPAEEDDEEGVYSDEEDIQGIEEVPPESVEPPAAVEVPP